MNKSNVVFESVLLGLTLLLGLGALVEILNRTSGQLIFLTLIWWAIFGLLQVIHSLVIAANYWSNEEIRNNLRIYFIGVALDFILIFICITNDSIGDIISLLSFILLPAALAIFLWYITYNFREKNTPELQLDENNDLFP